MNKKKIILIILLNILPLWGGLVGLLAQPQLVRHGSASQIVVSGKPMLMIGGEMGNSSATTLADVQKYFPHLRKLGLNTVLVPAYWNLIEPEEGKFDFTTIHDVITEARRNDLKVVLLWFGVWKNSMSCYAPEWFKTDTKRFPRAHVLDGRPVEEASSLSKNVLEADKKAFCKLLQYIKDNDSRDETVIMIQVENEIGMIEVPRDLSDDATRLYKPWAEKYGDNIYTEEMFQALTYAKYVEELAKAGKAVYNIPMYVNAALNSRGRKPGEYPSGGPLAHLINIWKGNAPHIDIFSPDLYDGDIRGWTEKYHMDKNGVYNPLFIPEIRLEDSDAVRALYVFGHHSGMGFCPFSIEDYPVYANVSADDSFSAEELAKDDQLNNFSPLTSHLSPLTSCYRLLRQLEPIILDKQGTDDIYGVHLDDNLREQTVTTPDGITFTVKHSYSLGWEPGAKDANWPEDGCLIIRQGKNDYLILGSGVVVTFGNRVGIAKCEQVEYTSNLSPLTSHLTTIRHLSGDQTHQGRHVRIPYGQFQIQHFKLYRY